MNAQSGLHAQARQSAQPMNDEWRRWIAENLLLGAHPATLENVLQKNGFNLHIARLEISTALPPPTAAICGRARLQSTTWLRRLIAITRA